MIVKRMRLATKDGKMTFTIPIEKLPCEISVIADIDGDERSVEIEYTSFALKETDFSELTKTGQWDLSYATQQRE